MNITDVKLDKELLGKNDSLVRIFKEQEKLAEKYCQIENNNLPNTHPETIPVAIDSYLGQAQIKERIFRTIIELSEVADCMKNKPWKDTPVETDILHMHEEVADAFHFFVEMCIFMGITAEDLFTLYMRKNAVNQFRQRSDY